MFNNLIKTKIIKYYIILFKMNMDRVFVIFSKKANLILKINVVNS